VAGSGVGSRGRPRGRGARAVREGRLRAGARHLREAVRGEDDPLYLRNIGRCYQKLKNPDKSIDAFKEYLRRAKVKSRERDEVNGFIKEMEDLKAQQAAAPPSAAARPRPSRRSSRRGSRRRRRPRRRPSPPPRRQP
jgi:hypothetical protein